MQVNPENEGNFLWTTDQYHIAENPDLVHPHGWLARDHNAWVRSHKMIQQLTRLFKARLIFGHDKVVADELIAEKKFFE